MAGNMPLDFGYQFLSSQSKSNRFVGLLVMALAIYEIWEERCQTSNQT
jgi:hypothetical protein